MSAPVIEETPVRTPVTTALPPLVHSTCMICVGPKRAFCGYEFKCLLPASRVRKSMVTCVVCTELDDVHDWGGHLWGRP